MPRRSLAAAAAGALSLTACTLAPAYQRPAPPVPAAWPQGPSYAAPTTGPQAASIGWKSFFFDPKLQAIVGEMLAQNRDLRVAVADIEAARASYHIQRADLVPTVTADASGTEQRLLPSQTGLSQPLTERAYAASIGFSAYELDLFGRIRSLAHAAQEQYFATEEVRRAVQTSLIAEAAADYYSLAADLDLLRVAQDTYASQKASLDIVRARFEHGQASMLEVRQAETTVEQARGDIAQFTTLAAQDRNALELVVGAPVADSLLPGGLPNARPVMTDLPGGLSSEVLLQRPDVLQSEHQLKAANADIGAARAAFFPTISLAAAAGQASPALSALFSGASRTWSYGPAASLPIFAGGRNLANLRGARAQRDVAQAQYEKAIQTAFRDVADALARRGTIAEQVAAHEALQSSAADALRLDTARYRVGSEPYLNVLIAQRTLYSAQQTLISTRLVEITNAVSLYRALGGGVM
ncbi:MAG: multidrug transporter [Phenylobacterium sp.]|nr:multidrug transporter [Phenylobacterium sp.]